MGNRQLPVQKVQNRVLSGNLGFDSLKQNAASHVSRHRLTIGRPEPLPCFAGQFGIQDIGDGQTVHQSQVDADAEFETSFVSKTGMLITLLLSGKLEFSLNGTEFEFNADKMPLALAWINLHPVEVTRRTRRGDELVKVQVHTPLSYFDADWVAGSNGFLDTHLKVLSWQPNLIVSNSALDMIGASQLSALRTRMASSRFAVEAFDALLDHLERQAGNGATPRIAAVRSYVERTVSDRPDLNRIASETGFSISDLQRKYRKVYGMTVIEHQRKLLLENAMVALKRGQLTVAQASQDAGYGNPSNFTAAFFKLFGVLPSRVKSQKKR